jgi:hypothetical protein
MGPGRQHEEILRVNEFAAGSARAKRGRQRIFAPPAIRTQLAGQGEGVDVVAGKAAARFDYRASLQLELVPTAPEEKKAREEDFSGIPGGIIDELFKSADGLVGASGNAAGGRAGGKEGAKRFPVRDEHVLSFGQLLGTHNLGISSAKVPQFISARQ